MSNPVIYQKIVLPLDDTAAAPSIQMGGGVLQSSGTGIYGDAATVNIAIGGVVKASVSASGIAGQLSNLLALTSSAGAGGADSEVMVVTGLLTTDTILSVTQKTPGANDEPLIGYNTQAANALTALYPADPGAGSVIVVAVKR